jgi:hemerythrin-like metal-binding protein
LYFQTGRKGLIDKERKIYLKDKSGESIPIILTMLDVLIKGKRNIALLIKSLGTIEKLEKERDKINDLLMSKEFDYTTKINILETFISEKGLKLPEGIEAQSDLITWNSNYTIELNIIDQQHKKWIEFINILYKSYKTNANKKEIAENISKLLDYTDYHFGFEEKYLEDFKCGNIENHKNEHAIFVTNIKEYQKLYKSGDNEAVYRLVIYLNNWVLNHIQTEDKRYVDCFKSNGLS